MKRALLFVFLSILLIAGATYFLDLDRFQTADEKRWHARITGFTTHIAHFKINNIYQTQTPGITLQWLAAPTTFTSTWTGQKATLLIHSLFLLTITSYLAHQLWGRTAASILLFLLAINPFFIAYNRVLGTDALFSQYLIIWFLCLALWSTTGRPRYLAFSALAASLSWLTKLPGIITIPATLAFITYHHFFVSTKLKVSGKSYLVWAGSFLAASCLILPPLIWNAPNILKDMFSIFSKEGYINEHTAPANFYLRTLIFFSTPIHLSLIFLIPFTWKKLSKTHQKHLVWLLLFASAFTVMMTIGSKKGDRYLLPTLVTIDVIAALVITPLWQQAIQKKPPIRIQIAALTTLLLIVWQITLLPRLHPYYLAYINPLTKPFFGDRRLGWGEGLDLAAAYLNQKPNAAQLKVATFYPSEFQNYFVGEAVDLHQWDTGNVDYAILYRAQLERGSDAWETDVWQQFQNKQPEKIIQLNGIDYLWIHKLR